MTQTSSPTALELAQRLFDSITAGDVEGVRAIYAPECVVWHNNDGVEQPAEDNLRTLAWVTRNIRELRYEEIRRQATETGFVQEHVLRGIAPNGKAVEVPACLVGTVAGGKITRLDEYLDSAAIAVLQS